MIIYLHRMVEESRTFNFMKPQTTYIQLGLLNISQAGSVRHETLPRIGSTCTMLFLEEVNAMLEIGTKI